MASSASTSTPNQQTSLFFPNAEGITRPNTLKRSMSSPKHPESTVEEMRGDVTLSGMDDSDSISSITRLAFGSRVKLSMTDVEDDTFDAVALVAKLAALPFKGRHQPADVVIPQSMALGFVKALKCHLQEKSREVIEHAGRLAFWRGHEPFLRPALSRSLSLP